MAKVTPSKSGPKTIQAKTRPDQDKGKVGAWWNAGSKRELCQNLIATTNYLKEVNAFRQRQASVYARLYGNIPIMGAAGTVATGLQNKSQMPIDRPTMNVISSCVDTLVSRLSQARPRPMFLTDNANYKERSLAKELNSFIAGELYQTKAYQLGPLIMRDAAVLNTGVIKVLEDTGTKKVSLERVLSTELLTDPNDAYYGEPRQLYHPKMIDRGVLGALHPDSGSNIEKASQAFIDQNDSTKSVSDMVIAVEGWHLPSGPESGDGLHVIATDGGIIFEENFEKPRFPFAFLHYSPQLVGFWGRSLAEMLMGTQVEINQLLAVITQSIKIVGVPRVFVEDGSKIVSAHLNNMIGAIVKFRGTPPNYQVAPCVPQELYGQLQRLVDYAYQQSGISALSAAAQKPQGLDSGEALRRFDDLQSDRFADLAKRHENFYIDLAYLITDKAMDIAKRDDKYQTVYPGRDGTKKIDLPSMDLLKDPFVIQCFPESSLPRDPAGRAAKITEYMQGGLYTPEEGRRLLGFADTEQEDKLLGAGQERILKCLDEIVEDGKYTPPDQFMEFADAEKKTVQYMNLYMAAGLEEKKADLLRQFFSQIQTLKQAAMPPPPPGVPGPGGPPGAPPGAGGPQMANPAPLPTSQLLPNVG